MSLSSRTGNDPVLLRSKAGSALTYHTTQVRAGGLLTDGRVLSEDEGRHEVPPHGGRLEDEEEDPEVMVDDVRALLPLPGRLDVSRDGQVGAFGRPQRGAAQTQDHRGGDEGVPAGTMSEEGQRFSSEVSPV